MTGIELAIKRAIEGGFIAGPHYTHKTFAGNNDRKEALSSPAFWQALAKIEKWPKYTRYEFHFSSHRTSKRSVRNKQGYRLRKQIYDPVKGAIHTDGSWLYQWHRFIDHLAENKDPNDFFNSLLSK